MEFVYDRTPSDVEFVIELTKKYQNGTITDAEKEIWNTGMKGAINAEDLNRIESNIATIASRMRISGNIQSCRTDWEKTSIPRPDDYERIRVNTKTIKNALRYATGVALVPDRPLNTYDKWNDIEKILYDIDDMYTRIIDSLYHCGDNLYTGEEVGVI